MNADLTPYAQAWTGKPPSARQTQALRVIAAYGAKHGHAPAARELGAAMGITPKGAVEHLERLERKGLIARRAPGSRVLVVTAAGRAFLDAHPAPEGAS